MASKSQTRAELPAAAGAGRAAESADGRAGIRTKRHLLAVHSAALGRSAFFLRPARRTWPKNALLSAPPRPQRALMLPGEPAGRNGAAARPVVDALGLRH